MLKVQVQFSGSSTFCPNGFLAFPPSFFVSSLLFHQFCKRKIVIWMIFFFFCPLEIPSTILHGKSYFHSIFILVNTHVHINCTINYFICLLKLIQRVCSNFPLCFTDMFRQELWWITMLTYLSFWHACGRWIIIIVLT